MQASKTSGSSSGPLSELQDLCSRGSVPDQDEVMDAVFWMQRIFVPLHTVVNRKLRLVTKSERPSSWWMPKPNVGSESWFRPLRCCNRLADFVQSDYTGKRRRDAQFF
jgi:hypothetical protein